MIIINCRVAFACVYGNSFKQKTIANDFSGPVSVASSESVTQTRPGDKSSVASGSANPKEVMVLTRIQETSKWDMSQLVLELDTKTAECEILQSLLDQRENSLHVGPWFFFFFDVLFFQFKLVFFVEVL